MKKLLLLGTVLAGLGFSLPASAQQTQCITNALAGGTVDAIRVPTLPCGLATNILILTLAGTNTVANPTLQMAGAAALPILTATGANPGIGALSGAGSIIMLTGTGSSWRIVSGNAPSFSGTLAVANGGTGRTTLTSNGVLVGAGTGAIVQTTAGTTGQVLAGNTGSPPTFQDLSSLGVSSLNFGSTGLTPNSATTGAITVAGTLVAASGGTGQSSYTTGDLLYASGASALSKLAGVATGNVLISGGVATAPSWGKVDLTSAVSGVLPVANGGTGQSSYTNGQLLIGNTATGGLNAATLTAGANMSITNGNGTITLNASGTLGCSPLGSSGELLTDSGAGGCTSNATATFVGSTLTVPILSAGTSASTPALTASTSFTLAGGTALTSNSGNGAILVTSTGTQTSGRCVEIDANGNHVAAAAGCNSGGLAAVTTKTASYNAAVNSQYCTDTVTGAATVTATLPASPANNDQIWFYPCSAYSTYPLVISRNGNNIQGLAENMTVSTDNAAFGLIFVTSYGWRLF